MKPHNTRKQYPPLKWSSTLRRKPKDIKEYFKLRFEELKKKKFNDEKAHCVILFEIGTAYYKSRYRTDVTVLECLAVGFLIFKDALQ